MQVGNRLSSQTIGNVLDRPRSQRHPGAAVLSSQWTLRGLLGGAPRGPGGLTSTSMSPTLTDPKIRMLRVEKIKKGCRRKARRRAAMEFCVLASRFSPLTELHVMDFLGRCCGDGPTGGHEGEAIHASQNGEGGDQADLVRHRADAEREDKLQKSSGEIKGVLYASHEMWRDHFHEAGVHGDAADAAGRPHDRVEEDGGDQPVRNWSADHACGYDRHGKRHRTTAAQAGDDGGSI